MDLNQKGLRLLMRVVLAAFLVLFSITLNAQNFQISGGYDQGATICANSRVYTWGNNRYQQGATTIMGIRGTADNTSVFLTTPMEAQLPVGVTVRQVDAGSGGHVLALACDGTVYSWGLNNHGQTGTGLAPPAVATPTQVQTGLQGDASGFLTGVINVSGGNDESYVILNTGEVMTWGENNNGQLGNGTTVNSTTPVYVLEPSTARLTGVVQVEGGDETGYALVDPDGDGVGTVYSWGGDGNGRLGRPSVNRNYAMPVVMADNVTPLSGITSISAGDVLCLALDTAGNVWAWGNGGWGGNTGQGITVSHTDPRKVVGGETGDPFLNAIAISAGQGFAMAVTSDNMAVSWGNDGEGDTGGSLGNCSDGQSSSPVYIDEAGGIPTTNVVSISDGDTWGYLIKDDGTVWTWGNDALGRLGDGGGETDQACLVQWTPPGGCTLPDLEPYAYLPDNFNTCLPYDSLLDSEFFSDPDYTITWYLDDAVIGGATNPTYNANAFGEYKVQIEYTGSAAPCGGYDPALDSLVISEWPNIFSDPGGQEFCADSIDALINGPGQYVWYTESTGGAVLDTSLGAAALDTATYHHLDVTNATGSPPHGPGDQFTVYVEEIANQVGWAGRLTAPDNITPSGNNTKQTMELQITVYEDIYLQSLKFQWRHGWSAHTDNLQINLYGQQQTCGAQLVADRSNILITGPSFSVFDPGDNAWDTTEVDMGGMLLQGSAAGTIYWIGMANWNGLTQNGFRILEHGSGFPYNDDVSGGNILQITSADKGDCPAGASEYGVFYDLNFTTAVKSCSREAVTVEMSAGCTLPIELLSFEGEKDGEVNVLDWTTVWELNNESFTIQRSIDGVNFIDIGSVAGNGNSTSIQYYTFTDNNPVNGVNYYRLKQTDYNGEYSYSEVISIDNSANFINIYPSPFTNTFNVSVTGEGTTVPVEVIDALGKVHLRIDATVGETITLGADLTKGSYLVRAYINDKVIVKPVIKF